MRFFRSDERSHGYLFPTLDITPPNIDYIFILILKRHEYCILRRRFVCVLYVKV
jgi:hypothetical protein